ncbi:MAG TPA: hypothetical protein G4N92_04870, partial [Anaerolineae bacterium]|nr:hypothetical protein [Anaerolineae bacterium]
MARRGWNEGSISKRSNGTWRAQILFAGKRINFSAKTRTECQQWLRKTLDQKDQGIGFEGRNIPLGTFLQDWISTKGIELKPKTKLQYEGLIKGLNSTSKCNFESVREVSCGKISASPTTKSKEHSWEHTHSLPKH